MLGFLPLAVESAAQEGKKVILGMLIVGLILISVIALGQAAKWLGPRRQERKRRQPQY